MTVAAVQVSKRGVDVADVIDRLDSFYAQNVVNALWADAVANRAEGPVLFLLPDALTAAVAAFGTWTAPAATLPLSWSEAFSRLEHHTPQAAA